MPQISPDYYPGADPLYPSANPQNPLDEKKDEPTAKERVNLYSEEDREYLSFLQKRLEDAKRMKEQPYPELDGMNVYQYYESNEKIANTHLDPKKNDDDVIVSAGTIESKLEALLSNINNLNLSAEVLAFDRDSTREVELGTALTDIIRQTETLEGADGAGDKEKKPIRQRELLKQGTVFVMEEWLRKFEVKKKLKKKFDGKFKQDADFYSKSLELVFEGPSRKLLYGPNVFLGDITEFFMEDQPFAFVMSHQDYKVAETRFCQFENWKFVKPGVQGYSSTDNYRTIYDNKWRLSDQLQKNQVEIILYQDQPRDEFQIIINGVCMLPIGFPLSAVAPMGKYNIAKQTFRVLNDKFAYGGSFVASGAVKQISNLIDEMLKLFVLKTRKSYTPPYVNTSGRVIDRRVLSAGRISMGILPTDLQPIGQEGQGVTAGEVQVFKEMQDLIDKNTVSDVFAGQEGNRQMTATQVLEQQKQAKLTLGLTVASCALLEQKLGYLRLWNILENWLEPTGSTVQELGEVRQMIKEYRRTNREVDIEGVGKGERMVMLQDGTLPSPEEIRAQEYDDQAKRGVMTQRIYINPDELRKARIKWFIVVNPREEESSPMYKMLFSEMTNGIMTLMNMGSKPNIEGIEEEFAKVWGKKRDKLFSAAPMPDMAAMSGVENGTPMTPPSQVRGAGENSPGVPKLPGGLSI